MLRTILLIIILLILAFLGMFIVPNLYRYLGDPIINAAFQFIQIIILFVILANIYEIKKKAIKY